MPPSKGTSPSRIFSSYRAIVTPCMPSQSLGGDQISPSFVVKSLISASSTPVTTTLPHRRRLARDLGVGMDRAAAVVQRELDGRVAWPWPPASLDLIGEHHAVGGGVLLDDLDAPVNVIDIAPIRTLISALTESRSGPLRHAAAFDAGDDAGRNRGSQRSSRRSVLLSRRNGLALQPCAVSPLSKGQVAPNNLQRQVGDLRAGRQLCCAAGNPGKTVGLGGDRDLMGLLAKQRCERDRTA